MKKIIYPPSPKRFRGIPDAFRPGAKIVFSPPNGKFSRPPCVSCEINKIKESVKNTNAHSLAPRCATP